MMVVMPVAMMMMAMTVVMVVAVMMVAVRMVTMAVHAASIMKAPRGRKCKNTPPKTKKERHGETFNPIFML